jgi:hypothetical protein
MIEALDLIKIGEDEFQSLLKDRASDAEQQLKDRPTGITPQLWIHCIDPATLEKSTTLCSLMVPFNEAAEKKEAMIGMGLKCYKDRKIPIAAFLTSEAWMSSDEPGVEPRFAKSRREVIVIFGLSMDQTRKGIASIPVVRDGAGKMLADSSTEIQTGVGTPILLWFFQGFAAMFTKFGPPIPK